MDILFAMLLGFLLDLAFGDPRWLPHPVVFIGNLVKFFEGLTRKIFPKSSAGEKLAGTLTVVLVIGITGLTTYFAIEFLKSKSFILGFILEVFWCYQIFATKELKSESMKVYNALKRGDLHRARRALSMIVGRDTENLSEEEVIKGAVETVAENTCDGVTAPMIFMAIGGAPLAMVYKAINTMDSMVGYKNNKYINFGMVAAKLDDLANYIPARITAILMIISAWILRFDYSNGFKIWKRDRRNHASPNSGQGESVCSGSLGIQLGGDSSYFGKTVAKKTIGDYLRPAEDEDIVRANSLMYMTSFLSIYVCIITGIFIHLAQRIMWR